MISYKSVYDISGEVVMTDTLGAMSDRVGVISRLKRMGHHKY